MTPTGKPDDDHEVERPEPGQPAEAPPPPQWLNEGPGSAAQLLPDYGADEAEPEAASTGAPEGEASGSSSGSDSDSDSGLNEAMHTVVIGGHSPSGSGPSNEDA
ncbi:hypothetical protein E1264_23460, partial [Actinomadura sp. KC216]|uniref:hypothetical protein n=1 Tax=Actinomadura sp. KC216 TaxID=2530370 RepID=UPI0010CE5E52